MTEMRKSLLMASKTLGWGFAILFFVTLLPPTSSADQHAGNAVVAMYRRDLQGSFTVRGSHGYRIAVTLNRGDASLVAYKGHSAASYQTTDAMATSKSFVAQFSKLGRVTVKFRPQPTESKSALVAECLRRATGTFVGEISFRGEKGFTSVRRTSAPGIVETSQRRSKCTHAQPETDEAVNARPNSPSVAIRTGFMSHGRIVIFRMGGDAISASRFWEREANVPLGLKQMLDREVGYAVHSSENNFGLHIARFAAVIGRPQSVDVRPDGRIVEVEPPAPFVGTATYRPCALRKWSGKMRIRLPGSEQTFVMQEIASVSSLDSICH